MVCHSFIMKIMKGCILVVIALIISISTALIYCNSNCQSTTMDQPKDNYENHYYQGGDNWTSIEIGKEAESLDDLSNSKRIVFESQDEMQSLRYQRYHEDNRNVKIIQE
ncbi:hypothetical protein K9M79_06810 [Candidatus Woesearchaeota archaeon]|nr:hypothetical protein [Candidatus Woesearchaeota archaeon]